jgi:hypothetical protein
MFTLFPLLPSELRYKIWLMLLPLPPQHLIFHSYSGSVFLKNHNVYTSNIFHINQESRSIALSQCAFLYPRQQPIITDLNKAFIILRTGTMWNLFSLSQIISDSKTRNRRVVIYDEVILHCMVHNRPPDRITNWGSGLSVFNFFVPFVKMKEEAGPGRENVVLVVHRKWNQRLVDDVDVEGFKRKWEENGEFRKMTERVVDVDDLPRIEHVLEEDFMVMCAE